MIIFDQLRISDDGKRMYINVHVNKADYFNDISLDSITIMTSDKISETSPNIPSSDYIYTKKIEGKEKELNLVLTSTDFTKTWEEDPHAMIFNQEDFSNTLFFIYIQCKGTPDACTPCPLDEKTTLGVTFDENILYQKVMNYTKELVASCEIPTNFVDFILLWDAFKSAIETEHYIPAIKFFHLLFDSWNSSDYNSYIQKCNCNG